MKTSALVAVVVASAALLSSGACIVVGKEERFTATGLSITLVERGQPLSGALIVRKLATVPDDTIQEVRTDSSGRAHLPKVSKIKYVQVLGQSVIPQDILLRRGDQELLLWEADCSGSEFDETLSGGKRRPIRLVCDPSRDLGRREIDSGKRTRCDEVPL